MAAAAAGTGAAAAAGTGAAAAGTLLRPAPPGGAAGRAPGRKKPGEQILPVEVAWGVPEGQDWPVKGALGGITDVALGIDNSFLCMHDGILEACHMTDEAHSHGRILQQDALDTLENNPYVQLDNISTGCEAGVTVEYIKEKGTCRAEARRGAKMAQGTVVGQFFSEGVHIWNMTINDLLLVTVGVVSSVGVESLRKSDGSPPDFVVCIKQDMFDNVAIVTRDPDTNLEHAVATFAFDVLSTPCTVSVSMCFWTGVVGFALNGEYLKAVHLPQGFVGDHSLGAHLRHGGEMEVFYRPTAPIRPLQPSHEFPEFSTSLVAGNPYLTWEPVDGEGCGVGFQNPMQSTAAHLFEQDVVIVTDGHHLRIIDSHTCKSHSVILTVGGVDMLGPDAWYCGIAFNEISQMLYVTNIWDQSVLQVVPHERHDRWPAKVIMKTFVTESLLQEYRSHLVLSCNENALYQTYKHFEKVPMMPEGAVTSPRANPAAAAGTTSPRNGGYGGGSPRRWHSQTFQGVGPWGIAILGDWIFVADSTLHCVMGWCEDTPHKEAIVVAGCPGNPGDKEGWGYHCRLRSPTALVVDESSMCLYIADTGNNKIVKMLLRSYDNRYEGCSVHINLKEARTEPTTLVQLERPLGMCLSTTTTSKNLIIAEQHTRNIYQISLLSSYAPKQGGVPFESPAERIVLLLKNVKRQIGKGDVAFALDEALTLLARGSRIFNTKIVDRKAMDEQLSRWLEGAFTEAEMDVRKTAEGKGVLYRRPSTQQDHNPFINVHQAVHFCRTQKLTKVKFNDFHRFEFNLFDHLVEAEQKGGILMQTMLYIFSYHRFAEKLNIDQQKLRILCKVVDMGYQDNPYHNKIHAADVMQTLHCFIVRSNIETWYTDLELFALFFAAAIHDYDHPGVTNMFLSSTRDPLAIRYNDAAVLENYHVAEAFLLMKKNPECDITLGLTQKQQAQFRDFVICMVLGTDMKQHFTMVTQFKTRYPDVTRQQPADEDKRLLSKVLLHSADISNPVKPASVAMEWAERIMCEFRNQGASENANGLPFSPFCEPDADIAKCQKGFIEFVVRPQFSAICTVFPTLGSLKETLEQNYSYWAQH